MIAFYFVSSYYYVILIIYYYYQGRFRRSFGQRSFRSDLLVGHFHSVNSTLWSLPSSSKYLYQCKCLPRMDHEQHVMKTWFSCLYTFLNVNYKLKDKNFTFITMWMFSLLKYYFYLSNILKYKFLCLKLMIATGKAR